MAGKKVQLYFYKYHDGDQVVGNRMPEFKNGGLGHDTEDPNSVVMELCDDGRKVFGIVEPVADNKIVRVTVSLDAVEIGEYEVAADFKPFVPAARRRRS